MFIKILTIYNFKIIILKTIFVVYYSRYFAELIIQYIYKRMTEL